MEKNYAILCRINRTGLDGKIKRGRWHTWKEYKDFQSVVDAWQHFKDVKLEGDTYNHRGEIESRFVWQFKPVNRSDEKRT